MILIAIIVLVAGFFFPPLWLVAIGIVVYIAATGKSRRSKAIETRIRRMIKGNQDFAHFPDIYYEAANGYAVDRGHRTFDQNSSSTTIALDGGVYWVVFSKAMDGGTLISIEDAFDARKRLEALVSF